MRRSEPSRLELLELDIDTRIALLWEQIGDVGKFDLDVMSKFMRAAYAFGYCDALKAPDPQAWLRSHGYLPPRRTK